MQVQLYYRSKGFSQTAEHEMKKKKIQKTQPKHKIQPRKKKTKNSEPIQKIHLRTVV